MLCFKEWLLLQEAETTKIVSVSPSVLVLSGDLADKLANQLLRKHEASSVAFYDLALTDLSMLDVSKLRRLQAAINSFNSKGDFAALEQLLNRLLGKKYIRQVTPDEHTASRKAKGYLNTDYERRQVWSYSQANKQVQLPHDFTFSDVIDVASMLHELGHRMFAHSGSAGTDEEWLADEKLASNFALEVLRLAGVDIHGVQQQFEKNYDTYVSHIKSRLTCPACGSSNTRDFGGGYRSCGDCYTDWN